MKADLPVDDRRAEEAAAPLDAGTGETRSKPRRGSFTPRSLTRMAAALLLVWFFGGVLLGALLILHHQDRVMDDFQSAKSHLLRGSTDDAAQALDSAAHRVDRVQAVLDWPQVRAVMSLPGTSAYRQDMQKLAGAAERLVGLASDAVEIAAMATGPDGLVEDDTVDLELLQSVSRSAIEMLDGLESIRGELEEMEPASWEVGLESGRTEALREVRTVLRRAKPMRDVLPVLPAMLGADGPRSYVVAILNPAELRFSGGAPLGLAYIELDQGHMEIAFRGQTYDLTDANSHIEWAPLENDPWLVPKPGESVVRSRLVNANFSASWPTAGEELLRAFKAQFGPAPDGVIAVDAMALGGIVEATGPLDVDGYGTITGANLVDKLLVDAYVTERDYERRHDLNDALMDVLLDRLMSGQHLLATMRSLERSLRTRNALVYLRDADEQAVLEANGFKGELARGGFRNSDFFGVYTQNTNASKVDVHQERSIEREVRLRPDGSAEISAKVTIHNDAPPYRGPGEDPEHGYLTSWSKPFVAIYVSQTAESVRMRVDGREVQPRMASEGGRTALATSLSLAPGDSSVITLDYELPTAAKISGSSMRYTLTLGSQPLVRAAKVTATVIPPDRYRVVTISGGRREAEGVVMARTLNRDFSMRMRLEQL